MDKPIENNFIYPKAPDFYPNEISNLNYSSFDHKIFDKDMEISKLRKKLDKKKKKILELKKRIKDLEDQVRALILRDYSYPITIDTTSTPPPKEDIIWTTTTTSN